MEVLKELVFKHPSYGFRKLFAYLRRSGKPWNHKKVYIVFKLLQLKRKQPLVQQEQVNSSWSMDFMSDSLMGIRKFRTFNVMGDCYRETLTIEIDTSLSSKRIIRILERIIAHRGKPKTIRTDNCPDFTSNDFELWCKD
jgi:putative transposase